MIELNEHEIQFVSGGVDLPGYPSTDPNEQVDSGFLPDTHVIH